MLFRAYEFEVFKGDGFLVALPFDLGGGTQGEDFDDLCDSVVDWLKMTLEDYDMRGVEPPEPTYGHEPEHGGKIVVFAVQAGRETVDKVSASEAARLLGVTQGRVSQMLSSGLLDGWRDGRNTYVTVDSITARLKETSGRGTRERVPA